MEIQRGQPQGAICGCPALPRCAGLIHWPQGDLEKIVDVGFPAVLNVTLRRTEQSERYQQVLQHYQYNLDMCWTEVPSRTCPHRDGKSKGSPPTGQAVNQGILLCEVRHDASEKGVGVS